MSEALKIKTLLLIMIACILLTSLNSMPLVNAQPIHTSLTITVPSPPQEKEFTIEATLKDENGNPLQNMDIHFWVCGSSRIGSNKTNSAGVASLKFTENTPFFYYPELALFEAKETSTFKINAVFDGTSTYAQSSSIDAYVAFFLMDYTLYMVGGGLIVVAFIGIVGYIVFRRRKKAITMPKTPKET